MNTDKLDNFTASYIECALWSSTDDDGEPLDGRYNSDDIAESAIEAMAKDCAEFQEANAELLAPIDSEQAGHDFWLTRNRHGAGFWDRGLGDVGKQLTDASHAYGTCDLYIGDDGKIYAS